MKSPAGRELPDAEAVLEVVDSVASPVREQRISKRALAETMGLELVGGFDPYYHREKRFWAVPLKRVLERLLPGVDLPAAQLLLLAKDGYAVPLDGARLLDGTAYLALADADRLAAGAQGWEQVGPAHADPAPFYVVWKGAERGDLERFPRPWGLGRIERARFETLYPHTVPEGSPAGSPARHGYDLYREACIRCHAINREGGRVGPDLNVPRSIVEYRPRAQIRAYIRDPLSFRYGVMPSHPQLSDMDLDALLAYFDVMSAHKYDPDGASAR
jgi:mono/diheme cytochrome c family protein